MVENSQVVPGAGASLQSLFLERQIIRFYRVRRSILQDVRGTYERKRQECQSGRKSITSTASFSLLSVFWCRSVTLYYTLEIYLIISPESPTILHPFDSRESPYGSVPSPTTRVTPPYCTHLIHPSHTTAPSCILLNFTLTRVAIRESAVRKSWLRARMAAVTVSAVVVVVAAAVTAAVAAEAVAVACLHNTD